MKHVLLLILLCLPLLSLAQHTSDVQNSRLKSLIGWNTHLPTGAGVLVAVIDSGIIEDFPGNLLPGQNFVDASQDMSDSEGHGTGSASVIWSMASAVTILPLKVTKNGVATHAHINAAVVYAIKSGAEIINLSIGFEIKNLEAIKKLVTTEEFDRTLFVTAAGNQGRYIPQTISENTLIVGATPLDLPIRSATYSDWGPGVEIAAPAGSSDDGITVFRSFRPLAYRRFNGTSAAAPVVTGAAVLMKQMNPNLNGKELKQAILESAVVEPGLDGRVGNSKFLSLR